MLWVTMQRTVSLRCMVLYNVLVEKKNYFLVGRPYLIYKFCLRMSNILKSLTPTNSYAHIGMGATSDIVINSS